LYGWFRYALKTNPTPQTLAEIVADAHMLAQQAPKEYEVLIPFREFPANAAGMPSESVARAKSLIQFS
jgi:hypothetical protein